MVNSLEVLETLEIWYSTYHVAITIQPDNTNKDNYLIDRMYGWLLYLCFNLPILS